MCSNEYSLSIYFNVKLNVVFFDDLKNKRWHDSCDATKLQSLKRSNSVGLDDFIRFSQEHVIVVIVRWGEV